MNILWNVAEMAVSWAFPQVGATLQAAGWANTAYKAAKCSAAFLSGDVTGGMSAAASSALTCEEIRDKCIQAAMDEKIYLPDDAKAKGWKITACWATYLICKIFKK